MRVVTAMVMCIWLVRVLQGGSVRLHVRLCGPTEYPSMVPEVS